MTRRLLVLAAAFILTVGIFPKTVTAQGLPPHKDPNTEQREFSSLSLLSYFGITLELLASRDYGNVAALLEQLRFTNLPEDLRLIVEGYIEMMASLGFELQSAESSLGLASAFLDLGIRPEAKRELDNAYGSLSKSRRLLQDMQPATDVLGRRLGAVGASASLSLREAFGQVQALLIDVDALWVRYDETLAQLEAHLDRQDGSDIPAPTVEPPVAGPTPIPRVELHFAEPTPVAGMEDSIVGPMPVAGVEDSIAGPAPIAVKEVPIVGASTAEDAPDPEMAGARFNTLVSLAIFSAAAAYITGALAVAWGRRSRGLARDGADNLTGPDLEKSGLAITGMPLADWAYFDPASPRGRVVSAYHQTAQILASGLALVYQPYFTLRDFKLPPGSRMSTAFNDLTSEAERALYDFDAPDDESVLRAEALADAVREEAI